jgi:hypothetical protein
VSRSEGHVGWSELTFLQHGVPRVAVSEKSEASRKKELKQIDAYQALVDSVQAKVYILN